MSSNLTENRFVLLQQEFRSFEHQHVFVTSLANLFLEFSELFLAHGSGRFL